MDGGEDAAADDGRCWPLGRSVTVKAPATSANLGCGFDSFGIALDLWLTVTVTVASEFSIDVDGNVEVPLDGSNLVVSSFWVGLRHLGRCPSSVSFRFTCRNQIPIAKGLGSSAASIVAGIGAAYALCGLDLQDKRVLVDLAALACSLEDHPDNIMPTVFGGLTVSVKRLPNEGWPALANNFNSSTMMKTGDYLVQKVPFPSEELSTLVFVPSRGLATKESRTLLPAAHPTESVTQNVGRGAMLIACLLLRDFDNLRHCVEDTVHEPYRKKLCASFAKIRETQKSIGPCLAAYLSGAGTSTVLWCRHADCGSVSNDFFEMCPELREEGSFQTLSASSVGVSMSR